MRRDVDRTDKDEIEDHRAWRCTAAHIDLDSLIHLISQRPYIGYGVVRPIRFLLESRSNRILRENSFSRKRCCPAGRSPLRGGFARGSSDRKRCCPTAPHPAGEAVAGASTRGASTRGCSGRKHCCPRAKHP
ncbi:hypothetical protein C4D60_Mb05t20040 [Musa balbisiana]|uniref:Uncharacterized protein n=1 Tax=Musa balbisiana TaxID=52838 RepID=A0A4S8JXH8_MUSBA|nr:hypothetical protein C4D60_Mb05t20040 [Musa balbisiana]